MPDTFEQWARGEIGRLRTEADALQRALDKFLESQGRKAIGVPFKCGTPIAFRPCDSKNLSRARCSGSASVRRRPISPLAHCSNVSGIAQSLSDAHSHTLGNWHRQGG